MRKTSVTFLLSHRLWDTGSDPDLVGRTVAAVMKAIRFRDGEQIAEMRVKREGLELYMPVGRVMIGSGHTSVTLTPDRFEEFEARVQAAFEQALGVETV